MVGLRELASLPRPAHLAQAELDIDISRAESPSRREHCAQLRHAINTLCTVLGRSPFSVTPDVVPEETVVECVKLWAERDGLNAYAVLCLLRQLTAIGVDCTGLWVLAVRGGGVRVCRLRDGSRVAAFG